jgi:hypothetical protein
MSLVAILDASGSRACGQAAPGLRLPRAQTGRRYLVFVRAGRESWHKRMILEDPDRNWDCCVNWYEAPAQEQVALGLMFLFERLKFIIRARKKFLRAWRYWRARLEDLARGGN